MPTWSYPYPRVVTTHDKPLSATDHNAFTRNMVWLGLRRKGQIQLRYPKVSRRAYVIRRNQPG